MKRILFSFIFLFPTFLFAQGFQVNLQGQKQSAMAGAGSGLILDETTVFFNPGAMSMVDHNAISGGIQPLLFKSAFNREGTNLTEYVKNKVATPFTTYALWGPKNAKWKVGLGVYTPFGGLVDWGNSWSGKYALTSLDLKSIFIQPSFSYRLTDRLGIGLGFVYNYGYVNLQRAIPINFSDGSDAHAELRGSGRGYGWNGGVYYSIPNVMAISLVHRSKVITKLNNGDAIFTVPTTASSGFPAGNTFDAKLPLPSTTTLGLGIPINEKISVAVDASFVNWKVYKELAFDYAENTTILPDTRSERNYGNGGAVRVGVQHKTTDKLIIRAGTAYVLTPVKEGYVTPEAPDANRFVLSAGLGYKLTRNWEVNASFLYEDIQSSSQTNLETSLSGTFKTHVYAPGVSIGYKW
jgi:long-chain fatty acid transport protein